MKQSKLAVTAFISLITESLKSKAYKKMVFSDELPMALKSFTQVNFPSKSISYAELQPDSVESTYVFSLNDGTEMCFNLKGDWLYIDCKQGVVPASILPEGIQTSVNKCFADAQVVRIDKSYSNYSILLSNGNRMLFDKCGHVA